MKLKALLVFLPFCSFDLGCGHCDGAIRKMRAQHAEWFRNRGRGRGACKRSGQGRPEAAKIVAIRPEETFRIRADGPKRPGPELLRLSGVDDSSWVLLDDSTGESVPAEISADSGAQMCLHGVGFNLKPRGPLAPGSYTLVLYLDKLRWPLVEPEDRAAYRHRPALVRRFRVAQ